MMILNWQLRTKQGGFTSAASLRLIPSLGDLLLFVKALQQLPSSRSNKNLSSHGRFIYSIDLASSETRAVRAGSPYWDVSAENGGSYQNLVVHVW